MTTTPAPEPDTVSVVVCAYTLDLWKNLRAAVQSVRAQTRKPLEVFVVIDGNDELEHRARAELEGVVVLRNAHEPGLSGGRQTGAEHARGSILAFLDDDAIADADWLEELVSAYQDPLVLGVGGLVEPRWEGPPPRWFPPEFNWVIGCTLPHVPRERARIRNPIGANMSMRASVLAAPVHSSRGWPVARAARPSPAPPRRLSSASAPRVPPRPLLALRTPRAGRAYRVARACQLALLRPPLRGRGPRQGDPVDDRRSGGRPAVRARVCDLRPSARTAAGARRGRAAPSTLTRARLGDCRRADPHHAPRTRAWCARWPCAERGSTNTSRRALRLVRVNVCSGGCMHPRPVGACTDRNYGVAPRRAIVPLRLRRRPRA